MRAWGQGPFLTKDPSLCWHSFVVVVRPPPPLVFAVVCCLFVREKYVHRLGIEPRRTPVLADIIIAHRPITTTLDSLSTAMIGRPGTLSLLRAASLRVRNDPPC